MKNSIFMVNDEPYCIWEVDVSGRNREFIEGIDVDYFNCVSDALQDSSDSKRASVALRIVLHHSLETFFSLIGAYIQAHDCAYAWISRCSTNDLRALVEGIGAPKNSIFTKLKIPAVSWETVSGSIALYAQGASDHKKSVELYALFWQRLAHEYLDQTHIDEYNSLKHGFRVKSGGFTLSIGKEAVYGEAPPPSEMKVLGGSEYGSSFIRVNKASDEKGDRSLVSERVSVLWKVEHITVLIELISMSIANVVTALKVANGVAEGTLEYVYPQEEKDFDRPWTQTTGIKNMTIHGIKKNQVEVLTKKQLLEVIAKHFSNSNAL